MLVTYLLISKSMVTKSYSKKKPVTGGEVGVSHHAWYSSIAHQSCRYLAELLCTWLCKSEKRTGVTREIAGRGCRETHEHRSWQWHKSYEITCRVYFLNHFPRWACPFCSKTYRVNCPAHVLQKKSSQWDQRPVWLIRIWACQPNDPLSHHKMFKTGHLPLPY